MKYHFNSRSKILTLALLALLSVTAMPREVNAQGKQFLKVPQQKTGAPERTAQSENQSFAPPANDNFANATVIGNISGNVTGTNVQATKETGEPNHAGNAGGHSVWYKWTAPALNYSATFTLKNSNFDTLLAVYTGSSVNALTPVASSDDYGHFFQGRVIFPATASAVYYIAVDGFNGGSGAETGTIQLAWHINIEPIIGNDYDGDGFDDLAVFRPSNGTWYARLFGGGLQAQQFGAAGDVPVPADYDGDDKTDVAIFRPSTGYWYMLKSFDNTVYFKQWGTSGDKPVAADYYGLGFASLAVFRPSNGTWYVFNQFTAQTIFQPFGQNGDRPAQRDFDGDGKADFVVFRPSNGTWYILNSLDSSFRAQAWGQSGDIPVPADYGSQLDGKADLAVFRPSTGAWYVLTSRTNSLLSAQWGQNGDIPQPEVSFGAGANFIVYRPGTSTFYIRDPNNASNTSFIQWGTPGDIPTAAPFVVEP